MKSRWLARGCLLVIAVMGCGEMALRLTPFPQELTQPFTPSTEFLDRNGQPLRTLLVDGRRFARSCELAAVSPALIDATISAEDKRFRRHMGVDPLAVMRAVRDAFSWSAKASGASTITQQLVKLSRPGPRTMTRKLSEIWLALRVEREWSKDRVMAEYLNRLDYGNLQFGIASASRFYFAKPPSDLTPAEAAFLAGLPRAPTRLNPHVNLPGAIQRQQWILTRMRKDGMLTGEAFERAIQQPMSLRKPSHDFEAPHFVDLLLQRKGLIPSRGGPLRTTLDLDLNHVIERALDEQLREIADKHATSGAAVVIDNNTGDVIALVASGDYFLPGTGQVNGAWTPRSPGSAVKPFAYMLALEAGANPCTIVADVPTDFPTETGLYRPNNYNHRFYGPVSLRFALGNSLNIAAIRTLQLAGGPTLLHRRLQDLGITTLSHPTDYYGLGLTLGNGEVRLLELTNAFATIGRLGIHRPYRLLLRQVTDPDFTRRVCDERATYLVADMLSDNAARVASFGLQSYLAFPFAVACKTGTSSNYRDNWAIGCTPEFSVGVWVGNADGTPMREITGVTGAAPLMHRIFTHLHQRYGTSEFKRPAGVLDARVHPLTGRASPRGDLISEKCLWEPEPERSNDFDSEGRIILPAEYSHWLSSDQNTLGDLVSAKPRPGKLRILSPPAGSTFFLDPDLPASAQRIGLKADGSAVEWTSETLPLDEADSGSLARLIEGRHTITARDTRSGETAQTWIEVREL